MALEAVPLLSEDSLLSWELEDTFKTVAPGSTWRAWGRAIEFRDLGPVHAAYRDAIAGAGREAHQIGHEGISYGPVTQGPWQVVDPRALALTWGQEESAPVSLGGGYYRHTAIPTKRGQLPPFSLQMLDLKAGTVVDGTTYLGTIQEAVAIRGEEGGEDGSGGRVMFAPSWRAHDDDPSITKKGVTLPSDEPYRKSHGLVDFYGDQDWRIHTWEFSMDNHVESSHLHRAADEDKPFESSPQGVTYDLTLEVTADGHVDATNDKLIRDLAGDKILGDGQIKYARTAGQDEWAINLSDILIRDPRKIRRRGRVRYQVDAIVRATTFEWVDQQSTRFLPA